jgi:phosphohistidine phosphatase
MDDPAARRIHLLRHAKSSWDQPALADHDRPLAPRGLRASKTMAGHLHDQGIQPELILCSSATRARQTLKPIVAALGDVEVRVEEQLYGASAADLLERLRLLPDHLESAMLIGHNPAMQELALGLAGGGEGRDSLALKYPTGALATLAFEGAGWSDLAAGRAELVAYVRPRDLS